MNFNTLWIIHRGCWLWILKHLCKHPKKLSQLWSHGGDLYLYAENQTKHQGTAWGFCVFIKCSCVAAYVKESKLRSNNMLLVSFLALCRSYGNYTWGLASKLFFHRKHHNSDLIYLKFWAAQVNRILICKQQDSDYYTINWFYFGITTE